MTIAVALSGGADSLLSLILLREAGAQVLALHGLFLPDQDKDPGLEDLQKLCAQLKIKLHCLDLRQEFEKLVITPFVQAYTQGLTPNPCALCNPAIKFGLLLDQAKALGAQALATGHYARLEQTDQGPLLFRGLDRAKDQSYFLACVPRTRFEYIQFPLATWTKDQVQKALAQWNLILPPKPESQEICFIPGNYRDFLSTRRTQPAPPGPIVLQDGTMLGEHQGLTNYTWGQRKGLGIAYEEPLYVLGKDKEKNRLIVGPKSATMTTKCYTGPPNFLVPQEQWPQEILVQTIYRQQPVPARIKIHESGLSIKFTQPHPLPAPGQVAALYSLQGQVLAGAIIAHGVSHAP